MAADRNGDSGGVAAGGTHQRVIESVNPFIAGRRVVGESCRLRGQAHISALVLVVGGDVIVAVGMPAKSFPNTPGAATEILIFPVAV